MRVVATGGSTVFIEAATSVLAGFYVGSVSWSNWNLEMLVFVEEGKPENQERNLRSKTRTNKKLNPHVAPGQNRTQATWWEVSALSTVPSLFPSMLLTV